MVAHIYTPIGVGGWPGLHNKFKASLSKSLRVCLKTKQNKKVQELGVEETTLSLDPQQLCKKPGVGVYAYNLSSGKKETGWSLGLTGQLVLLNQ